MMTGASLLPTGHFIRRATLEVLRPERLKVMAPPLGELDNDFYIDLLIERQTPQGQTGGGGWTGEKPAAIGISLDDGATQAPACALLAWLRDADVSDTPPGRYERVLFAAERAVAAVKAGQHASGLFVQFPTFNATDANGIFIYARRNESYRAQPTINDRCTADAALVLRLAWEVMGDRDAYDRLQRCALTHGRLFHAHDALFEQYDGATWRPNNPPPMIPTHARDHEPAERSCRAVAWGLETILDALETPPPDGFAGVPPLDEVAERMTTWLESRAHWIARELWWPQYVAADGSPLFCTSSGATTPLNAQAHSPDAGWWTKDPRATRARAHALLNATTEPTEDTE